MWVRISDKDLNSLMVYVLMPLLALVGILLTLIGFNAIRLERVQIKDGFRKNLRWQGPLLVLVGIGCVIAHVLNK